jgi:perosamine synthetase
MSDFIPLSVPSIKGNEWKYVKECLDTEWVSSVGSYVTKFEEEICKYTGADYAIACVNGTAALHISLIIAGVSRDDEVIVPSLTFIAPVNVIRYVGAEPVFMDSDKYYNIDAEKFTDFIISNTEFRNGKTYNKLSGKRIAGVIPVHVFGNAVDIEPIVTISRERGIKVIEDSTESLGTVYIKGSLENIHPGTIGDLGCISFNGNKIITTGGGGMIITDNKEYAERAKYLTFQAKDDEVKYIHNDVGYNYRLTNIQAALGIAQLEQLPGFLEKKRNNYQRYVDAINEIEGLCVAKSPHYARNNHWMYPLQIDEKIFGMSRDELLNHLASHNIQTRPVWHLNHLQKPFENCIEYKIENAFFLVSRTLELPCSVSLTDENISSIVEKLKNV